MTSPRWMILVCFSLISANEQNSLPAIIAQMSRAIADSQVRSLGAQRSSLLRQVSGLHGPETHYSTGSQYAAVVKQKDVLQGQLNVFVRYNNYGWKYYRGSFYYVSTSTANWQASRNYCTARGADLVVVNDAFENNFTRGLKRKAWIGLYRSGSNWRWVDGSYLSS
ncbi:C-type lectin domain family 4 member F, partial [Oryzias melastigma]